MAKQAMGTDEVRKQFEEARKRIADARRVDATSMAALNKRLKELAETAKKDAKRRMDETRKQEKVLTALERRLGIKKREIAPRKVMSQTQNALKNKTEYTPINAGVSAVKRGVRGALGL